MFHVGSASIAAFHQAVVATNLLAFSDPSRVSGVVHRPMQSHPIITKDGLPLYTIVGVYHSHAVIGYQPTMDYNGPIHSGSLLVGWYTFTCCRHEPLY